MKRITQYTVLALLGLACLTACGSNGTEIRTFQDPETGSCYVEIHENKQGGPDKDSTFLIPCVIYTEAP